MENVNGSILKFLSGIKMLHFLVYVLIFIIFGSAFLFPSPWKPTFLNFVEANFSKKESALQFLIFSYIVGLLLYSFSVLCFRLWYKISPPQNESSSHKRVKYIKTINYREEHNLVADTFTLIDFFSLNVRCLFATAVWLFVSLLSQNFHIIALLTTLGLVVIFLLFGLELIADNETRSFVGLIKDVVAEKGEKKSKGADSA